MLVLFEPITLYSNNVDDFWFDLYDILPVLLPVFVCTILALCVVFSIFYIIGRRISKPGIFYFVTIAFFGFFIITYIQGNFLANSLPGLNGGGFNWREYRVEAVMSCVLWLVVFGALIVAVKKFKSEKVLKIVPYVSLAAFAMMFVSLLTTIATKPALENKSSAVATSKYYNQASSKRNFFILMLDAIDSRSFDNLLKDADYYQNTFKDFSYFPDTLSYYAYTRDSVPYIFYQTPNENETSFGEYSRTAYSNSSLFANLKDEGYKMRLYEDDLTVNGDTSDAFDNLVETMSISRKSFLEEILRYDLYKYLPYPLKGKAHIENSYFGAAEIPSDSESKFAWGDKVNYDIFKNENIEIVDDKVFHFIHLEGAHIWFNLDEDLNPVDKTVGTYSQKQTATMKVIAAYIDRLKEAGVYDNSSIVIMADHGYKDGVWEYDYILDRFNPILYIKGVDEHHDQMLRSDKPVSFADLGEAFEDLRLGKKSTELFSDIEYPRTRKLIYYVWSHENHMVEYETDAEAWNSDAMVETGRVFDR